MSTTIRAVLSKKNSNYISKHRYYELKHFCLQYPEWREEYHKLYLEPGAYQIRDPHDHMTSDRTADVAIRRNKLRKKMELVEQTALAVDPGLAEYILIAVTDGMSYEWLRTRKDIPCCREVFYETYRRFFKLLSDSQ